MFIGSTGSVGLGSGWNASSLPTFALSFQNNYTATIGVQATASGVVGKYLEITGGSTVAGGTDIAGGTLYLEAGKGTGTGTSNIEFWTGTTLGTGTTLQTLALKMKLNGAGLLDVSGGVLLSGGNMTMTGGAKIAWQSGAVMYGASGVFTLYSSEAETNFTMMKFGGTTSSFPALKRSGTGLIFRLADDSADAPITASDVISTGVVRLMGYTVATLPAGTI